MIPVKINDKALCEIFEPGTAFAEYTDAQFHEYCLSKMMYPTTVTLVSETYSRDAERTADYELENLRIVNRKAKPTFTWSLLRADYVDKLMRALSYNYNFKDDKGIVQPINAAVIKVTYQDFTGVRTINAYLGQTIEGTLVEYEGVLYWENFTIAFPER